MIEGGSMAPIPDVIRPEPIETAGVTGVVLNDEVSLGLVGREDGSDRQGTRMREAFNRVAKTDAIVRMGDSMCEECRKWKKKSGVVNIGCVTSGVDPRAACGECHSKSIGHRCDWGKKKVAVGDAQGVQSGVAGVMGKLEEVESVITGGTNAFGELDQFEGWKGLD